MNRLNECAMMQSPTYMFACIAVAVRCCHRY